MRDLLGAIKSLLSNGLPASLGQKTSAASMPVVINSDADWIKSEDSAAGSGDKGVAALTKRTDTAATSAGTDGDYATLNTDATGRVWAHVGIVDQVTPGTGATDLGKAEDAARASGDVGVMLLAVRNDAGSVLTSADGDYSSISVTSRGVIVNAGTLAATDGASGTTNQLIDLAGTARAIAVQGAIYNGTTWDLQRNNVAGTALASAARTATTNSADLVNYNGRGVVVVLDVTAFAATPTITLTVEGKDPVSGGYYTILSGAAINVAGTSRNVYVVYPGVTETANVDASHPLPRTFRITVTHGDADSVTYSVGYDNVL